jgi:ribosomal protein L21E
MVKRIGTARRKTRQKLSKPLRSKGKLSLRQYFQEFVDDEKVVLKAEPAVQDGMYHPRFHGKHGIIKGSQGECYFVEINDQGKTKNLLVHPVHLKKI